MSFATLALIGAAALVGPLLAARSRWHVPVVLDELAAGLVLGATGFDLLDSSDPIDSLRPDGPAVFQRRPQVAVA